MDYNISIDEYQGVINNVKSKLNLTYDYHGPMLNIANHRAHVRNISVDDAIAYVTGKLLIQTRRYISDEDIGLIDESKYDGELIQLDEHFMFRKKIQYVNAILQNLFDIEREMLFENAIYNLISNINDLSNMYNIVPIFNSTTTLVESFIAIIIKIKNAGRMNEVYVRYYKYFRDRNPRLMKITEEYLLESVGILRRNNDNDTRGGSKLKSKSKPKPKPKSKPKYKPKSKKPKSKSKSSKKKYILDLVVENISLKMAKKHIYNVLKIFLKFNYNIILNITLYLLPKLFHIYLIRQSPRRTPELERSETEVSFTTNLLMATPSILFIK